jgi:lysophospholipase L1-like esterase/NADH:ubiquinone oxidoreductase subunit 6 (subunit J)
MWLACLPLLWPRSAMFLQNANPTTFHWRQYLGTSLALLLGAWALYWIFHARFFRWSVDDEKPVFESGRLRKAPLCALVLTLILLTFFPTIFGSSRSIAATSSQKTNTNLKKENFKKGQTIFFSDKNLRSPEINTVLRLQPERIIDVFIGDASRENQIGLPLWDFLRIDVPQKTVSLRHSDGFLKQDSRPMSQEELDKLEFNIILNVPIYANTGASVRAEVNRDKIRILSHVVEGKVGLVIHQGKAEVIHLYTQQTLPQFKSWPDFWSTERIIFFAFSFVILTASLFALLAPAPFWKTLAFALLTLSPAILFLIFYNGDAGRAMAGFLLLFAGGAAARWYWGMTQCGKAWVYNVLTVGSLIIVGVCVEWALRSHPHYNTALKGDWFFGEQRSKFVFRPHVEGDLVWNSYTHQYTFRDVKYSNEKPADTTRVVCLGGSSTHGIGVGAPELRFCNKMEAKLEERSGQNFEVVNGGLVSYTSFDNLLMMKRDILYLNPDVVVLNFGVNDGFPAWWLNASQPETYAQQKAIWDNKNGAALALARSRTLRALVQQAKTLALPWRTSLGSVHVPLEKYKEILKEFAQLSREHDFKLVFVCEPSWESRQPGESYYEKYYNAMREVAQRENIICVEPLKAMRERPFDKFFVDVVHLSEAGHELMSELLTGAVRQALAAGEDQSS